MVPQLLLSLLLLLLIYFVLILDQCFTEKLQIIYSNGTLIVWFIQFSPVFVIIMEDLLLLLRLDRIGVKDIRLFGVTDRRSLGSQNHDLK